MSKLKETNKKIEETVVSGYKKVGRYSCKWIQKGRRYSCRWIQKNGR